MKTSVTNLVFGSAIGVALVCASTASAGGHKSSGGGGGKSGGRSHSMSFKSLSTSRSNIGSGNSNSLSFKKLSSNHVVSGNSGINVNKLSSRMNTSLANKGIGLSQTLKSKGNNGIALNHNVHVLKNDKTFNNTLYKNFNNLSVNKFDKNSKNFFCKKDNCWFDWCYPKSSCYPYYFGCYYPWYGCYNFVTPCYTSCNYSSITVLPNVAPTRTLVAVGSVLMVNGESFGDKAGAARLRISGIAMPIEVLEWTLAGVKVRLPRVEITGTTPAEIEVYRGDGTLAAKTSIQLTAASEQVAVGG